MNFVVTDVYVNGILVVMYHPYAPCLHGKVAIHAQPVAVFPELVYAAPHCTIQLLPCVGCHHVVQILGLTGSPAGCTSPVRSQNPTGMTVPCKVFVNQQRGLAMLFPLCGCHVST